MNIRRSLLFSIVLILAITTSTISAFGNELSPVDWQSSNTSRENFAQYIIDFVTTGGYGSIQEQSLLSTVSHAMNVIGLSLMAWLCAVGAVTFVIHTGNKGTVGGQVISSFWMPIRIATAVILLTPLPSGYSSVQLLVVKVAETGSQGANYLMSEGLDFLYENGAYLPAPLADSYPLVAGWVGSEACRIYVNSATNRETIVPRVRIVESDGMREIQYTYDLQEDGTGPNKHDPRIGFCGKLSIKVSQNSLIPDANDAKHIGPDKIVQGFVDVIENHQPKVTAIAELILADEKELRALQEYGEPHQDAYETKLAMVDESIRSAGGKLVSLSNSYNRSLASIIATTANGLAAEYSGANWKEEINKYGWPALGTVFWQINKSQERINFLARSLSAAYHDPQPDKNFSTDERFLEISKRLRGMLKVAAETPRPSSEFKDVILISVANSGADGTGDGVKSIFISTAQSIAKSLVLGDSSADILVRLQYSGSVIGASAEAAWWALAGAKSVAIGLSHSITFAAQNLSNSASQTPLIGPLLGSGAAVLGAPGVFAAKTGSSLVSDAANYFQNLLTPLMFAGLVLAVILPAIPLFLWFSGVISWTLFFVECLLVSPFWIAAHGTAEKEGWGTEHTRQGYMLMIGLFIAPVLRVAGFFAIFLVLTLVGVIVQWVFDYSAGVLMSGWISPLPIVGGALIGVFAAYHFIVRIFSLPNELFEKGLRWVNGGQEVTGDSRSSDNTNQALIVGAGRAEQ